MSDNLKLLKKLFVKGVQHNIDASIVIDDSTGKDIPTLINDTITALQNGDIQTLQTNFEALNSTVNTFLEGDADGGTLDRLKELVKAINDNKDSIDALVSDKVAKADIIDGLESTDATKVLSAAQGKALKTLIDAAIAAQHSHSNKTILDDISKNDTTGNLVFNNVELKDDTCFAVVATDEEAADPQYTNKIVFVAAEPTDHTQG